MSAEHHYQPPDIHVNWDRPVEHEERQNNIENVNRGMVDLIRMMGHEREIGKPLVHVYDDLDADKPVAVEMDKEWQQMVLFGIGRERQYLEKQGVVFDFRPQHGREGDDTA